MVKPVSLSHLYITSREKNTCSRDAVTKLVYPYIVYTPYMSSLSLGSSTLKLARLFINSNVQCSMFITRSMRMRKSIENTCERRENVLRIPEVAVPLSRVFMPLVWFICVLKT